MDTTTIVTIVSLKFVTTQRIARNFTMRLPITTMVVNVKIVYENIGCWRDE